VAAPLLGAYAASKFALEALSDALRSELRPWGMHVCSVQPGPIDTPIWGKFRSAATALQAVLPPQTDSLYGAAMRAAARQPVMLPPEHVARAVWHALTARWPRARYPIGMPGYSAEFVARFAPDRLRNWLVQV
jgi:NAD(P)-dependent dehydrogenase (short-subunit alcohol dehydrogenase family)